MHSLDFVHLDLKTENIVITIKGQYKLTDFGSCVRLRRTEYGDTRPVRLSGIIGTPEIMAPEVVAENLVWEVADWWSYGCVLFEMLTGDSPFYDASCPDVLSIMERVLRGNFTFPNAFLFSDAVVDLVRGLITRDPSVRLGARPHGQSAVAGHAWFQGTTEPIAQPGALEATGGGDQELVDGLGLAAATPDIFVGAEMPAGEDLMRDLIALSQPVTIAHGQNATVAA